MLACLNFANSKHHRQYIRVNISHIYTVSDNKSVTSIIHESETPIICTLQRIDNAYRVYIMQLRTACNADVPLLNKD